MTEAFWTLLHLTICSPLLNFKLLKAEVELEEKEGFSLLYNTLDSHVKKSILIPSTALADIATALEHGCTSELASLGPTER